MKKVLLRCGKTVWSDIKKYRYVMVVIILYWGVTRLLFHAYCPQLLITGIPCAGCGMTRAIFFLLTGQITRALTLNPASILWLFYLLWVIVFRYLLGRKVPMWCGILSIVLILTITVYIFRMVTVFPAYPPMVYRSENLLSYVIPQYKELLGIIWNRL